MKFVDDDDDDEVSHIHLCDWYRFLQVGQDAPSGGWGKEVSYVYSPTNLLMSVPTFSNFEIFQIRKKITSINRLLQLLITY